MQKQQLNYWNLLLSTNLTGALPLAVQDGVMSMPTEPLIEGIPPSVTSLGFFYDFDCSQYCWNQFWYCVKYMTMKSDHCLVFRDVVNYFC